MLKILMFVFFSLCLLNIINAQDYNSMGNEAMKSGKYQTAVDYFRNAFEQNPSDDITRKINLAQNLKTEFDEIDAAIRSNNVEKAEMHVNNVLMIDPTNEFIEEKRVEIKQVSQQNSKLKSRRRMANFTDGFKGGDATHAMLGGFHFRFGYSNINTSSFVDRLNDNADAYALDMYYNNSKAFPLTFEAGFKSSTSYQGINLGALLSYKFSNHFTLDYGGGYQFGTLYAKEGLDNEDFSNPYLKAGCTLMFDGKNWGGLNYSYIYGINSISTIPTHNITYIFGRAPTKWISSLALVIGLIAIMGNAGQ